MYRRYIGYTININEHDSIAKTFHTKDFWRHSRCLTTPMLTGWTLLGRWKVCDCYINIWAYWKCIKYLGYTFNKPTLCWARESPKPHVVTYAHQIRWLIFPQLFFPLEYNANYMKNCMNNLINTDNFFIAPQFGANDINNTLLKREYQS